MLYLVTMHVFKCFKDTRMAPKNCLCKNKQKFYVNVNWNPNSSIRWVSSVLSECKVIYCFVACIGHGYILNTLDMLLLKSIWLGSWLAVYVACMRMYNMWWYGWPSYSKIHRELLFPHVRHKEMQRVLIMCTWWCVGVYVHLGVYADFIVIIVYS